MECAVHVYSLQITCRTMKCMFSVMDCIFCSGTANAMEILAGPSDDG